MIAPEDSFDLINEEFSRYLRKLKKEAAYASISRLVESFIVITRQFSFSTEEYLYYLQKYQNAPLGLTDLSDNQILAYLENIINRLEQITGEKIRISALKPLDLTEIDIDSSPNIHQINSEEVNVPQEIFPLEKDLEIDLEVGLEEELEPFPELQEILHETVSLADLSDLSPLKKNTSTVMKGDPDLEDILNGFKSREKDQIQPNIHLVRTLYDFAFDNPIPSFSEFRNLDDSVIDTSIPPPRFFNKSHTER